MNEEDKNTEEETRPYTEWTPEELLEEMTARQRAFCEHYLSNGFNASQAARDAGYSEKSAHYLGYETLNKPYVKAYMGLRMKEQVMGSNEVLARIGRIARGDIGDFLDVKDDGTIEVSLKQAQDLGLTHLIKKVRSKTTPEYDEATQKTINTTEVYVELYSSHDALKDIARTLGLFKDNLNASIDGMVGVMRTSGQDLDVNQWAEKVATYHQQVQEKMGSN